jgi:apolipoprotein N-acyltransferase
MLRVLNPSLFHSLSLGLATALAFSFFLYSAHYNLTCTACNTFLGLIALALLLRLGRAALLFGGFFIGLAWFYWIGYSFEYYHTGYMIPIVSLGFGGVYLIYFGLLSLSNDARIRAALLFGLSFVAPFNFNWMVPELLFVESYFGIEKWQFALVLAALALFFTCKRLYRHGAWLLLLGATQYSTPHYTLPELKIRLVATDLPQELKWQSYMESRINQSNFSAIERAIDEGYDVVVLPESAFPLFLNLRPDLMEQLKVLSRSIVIITGSLQYEEGANYNVTYLFDNATMQIFKKMVLVPFGEYIPLPSFMRDYVNRTFFDGASDYLHAQSPSDFQIHGVWFRNAVCYEATHEDLYVTHPRYMIAISNNAWFMPSIEPTLQRLLMRYYAKRHNTVIFHAANAAGTGIITP